MGGVLPACLAHPQETLRYLRSAYENDTTLVGLCTGSFVLAMAGLLDDRRCAVHFEHINEFRRMFPRAMPEADRIFVKEQRIITCPGGTSAFDVALDLIELCWGRTRANKVVPSLFVERHRAAHHMPRRPYADLAACGDRHVEQAVSLMEQNLSKPYTVQEIVQSLNTSERVLYRAFWKHAGDTPAKVSRRLRLANGQWLLVNTTRTVAHIAAACGFADAAHFCRLFKDAYGETPSRFRNPMPAGTAPRLPVERERESLCRKNRRIVVVLFGGAAAPCAGRRWTGAAAVRARRWRGVVSPVLPRRPNTVRNEGDPLRCGRCGPSPPAPYPK